MKKIPSLFKRNYETDRNVRNEIVEGSEWVVHGEGIATRKFDGTCCMVKDSKLYKRYDAKKGREPPMGFVAAQDPDPVTGHWPGWIEVGWGSDDKWYREACGDPDKVQLPNGSYELCGPKVQGNPEKCEKHVLIPHGKEILADCPRDFEGIKQYLTNHNIEGIVWHRLALFGKAAGMITPNSSPLAMALESCTADTRA